TSMSSLITMIGVALGVGAVCLFLSAHNGFEREVRERILGATSHITIFALGTGDNLMADQNDVMERTRRLDGVLGASPFIYYKSGIQSRSTGDGIVVRGIDPELELATGTLADNIIYGIYGFIPPVADSTERKVPGILLGVDLADRLAVGIGDPVILYSISDQTLAPTAVPKKGYFRVSGIFKSGFAEYDAQLAYISIPDAQELFNMGDKVTGVHLKVENIFNIDPVVELVEQTLGEDYDIVPWQELYSNLFTWVEMEKLVIYLVFALMISIAAFSVISTLVMIVLEKRSEIAALKTIGLTGAAIRRIFVYNGLTIGVIGCLGGWALAGVITYIQNTFHLLSLPADVYFISYLPFDPHLMDYLIIGAATLLVSFLAGLYPAQRAASQSVVEALRR
ncbi:MAG TPA: ABC transporter permease, partial [candidate division Zixibacteria bacterium]|nr:ABC transporter permease [candidate division Zixibacteria bacterium]